MTYAPRSAAIVFSCSIKAVAIPWRRWDAATAARWGLVNQVVAVDQLMDTARDYARRIAANAPLAVQAAKELALPSSRRR